MMQTVTVSIVSHGHGVMLPGLLDDLAACPEVAGVILTRNIPEPELQLQRPGWLSIIDNLQPKGFGANHNAAFRHAKTPYFAVLNPDVRLNGNPFPVLLACLQDPHVGLCAPAVVNPMGAVEDNARGFPSLLELVSKFFGCSDACLPYALGDADRQVPWLAGMFMLLRREDYAALGGFDEGFFLYYEDVDLCARLRRRGLQIVICPSVHVVHDARRASRHNLRHMRWHGASMLRYFLKHGWRGGQVL